VTRASGSARAAGGNGVAAGRPIAAREAVQVQVRDLAPVRLLFVARDDRVYVIPSTSDARWSAAALRVGTCNIDRGDGVRRRAAAELVTDADEVGRVRDAFRGKYGEGAWIEYFARSDRVLRLDVGRPPAPASDLDRTRSEFDAAAPLYTAAVESNRVQRYLKHRSADLLAETFAGLDPLIELGPGTGFETLPLLAAGHSVVAVDISAGMLRELGSRAAARGLAARLTTVESGLGQLGAALADRPDGAFAGAYSTFGAPNLATDVAHLGADLARLVRPGGRVVVTSLNRPGFSSVVWEAVAGDRRGVWARTQRRIPAGGYRFPLDVHPRNPSFWDRVLDPGFERCATRAVSVLAPPFDSERLDVALGETGRRRVAALDAAVSRFGLLSPLGEWSMLTYRRVARPEVG
jgi:SAM-dependent methyltransferase